MRDRELTPLHGRIRQEPGSLLGLLTRVDRIDLLNRALRGWTTEPWLNAIRVANASDEALILFADNAAVLTTLRYKREALLLYLREQYGQPFSRIEARVRPKSK